MAALLSNCADVAGAAPPTSVFFFFFFLLRSTRDEPEPASRHETCCFPLLPTICRFAPLPSTAVRVLAEDDVDEAPEDDGASVINTAADNFCLAAVIAVSACRKVASPSGTARCVEITMVCTVPLRKWAIISSAVSSSSSGDSSPTPRKHLTCRQQLEH